MNVIIETGIIKETEKAILVTFWSSGNFEGFKACEKYCKQSAWLPKSQIEIISKGNKTSTYTTYKNLKTNSYGTISEGQAIKTVINESAVIIIPEWLYKDKMTYGFSI